MNIRFSSDLKYLLVALLVLIGIGSFWYTQTIANRLLENERQSVELWAKALQFTSSDLFPETRQELRVLSEWLQKQPKSAGRDRFLRGLERAQTDLANASLNFVTSEIILKQRFDIPAVIVDDENNILLSRNINEKRLTGDWRSRLNLSEEPIKIPLFTLDSVQYQYLYYGNGTIVQTLRFFPLIQFALLFLVLGLAYISWSSIRNNEQSSLLVGMSREAAHQLGTPMSGLMGWVELLKAQSEDEHIQMIATELNKDIERLKQVADRFSKIGSEPELNKQRVGPHLEHVCEYFERRMPRLGKQVRFRKKIESKAQICMNKELFEWAIENLLKNALDSIERKQHGAFISLFSYQVDEYLIIDIEDSGKGIEKKNQSRVFKPGFSTKKRGWGLGLSLTKRIIQEYHRGEIRIIRSELGEGTTFRISLPLSV